MGYAKQIKTCIQDYLEKENWAYTFDEEQALFSVKIKLEGRLNQCELAICIREDHYIVYAEIAISANENCLSLVSEYLHRVNFGLKRGAFELDFNDGEIRYKICVDCGDECDSMPSESVIARSIKIPCMMFEQYGDGLLGVIFGNLTPPEAFDLSVD